MIQNPYDSLSDDEEAQLHANNCGCSIFRNKHLSLQLVAIHSIFVDLEDSFNKCEKEKVGSVLMRYEDNILQKYRFEVIVSSMKKESIRCQLNLMNASFSEIISFIKRGDDSTRKQIYVSIQLLNESEYEKFKKRYKDSSKDGLFERNIIS